MWFLIFLGVIGVDQATKWWVSQVGSMNSNTGLAFGLGQWLDARSLAFCLLVLIVAVTWKTRQELGKQPVVAGLFLGGAVSNIIDRLISGGVKDWLTLPGLPLTNNLADWAITLALVIGLYEYIKQKYDRHS